MNDIGHFAHPTREVAFHVPIPSLQAAPIQLWQSLSHRSKPEFHRLFLGCKLANCLDRQEIRLG